MKKIFLTLAAIATVIACEKVETPKSADSLYVTVPASFEKPNDPTTKAEITEDGSTFSISISDKDAFGLTQYQSMSSRSYKQWKYTGGSLGGEIFADYDGPCLIMSGTTLGSTSGMGGGSNAIRGTIAESQTKSFVKPLLMAKVDKITEAELISFKTMNAFLKFNVNKAEDVGDISIKTITISSDSYIAGFFGFTVDTDFLGGFNEEFKHEKRYKTITLDCENTSLSTGVSTFYASIVYGELQPLRVTFTFSDNSTIVKTLGKNNGITLERNTVYALPIVTYKGSGATEPEPGTTDPVETITTIASVDLAAKGFANATEVTSVEVNDDITLAFSKGTNSNAPKYYTSGTAVRVYGSNTFTVASNNGKITKIELAFGAPDGSNEITATPGNFVSPKWTGSADSVTFTIGGTTGNRRIKEIVVTYEKPKSEK